MKNLKNLGKALSKAEQKEVNGGRPLISCPELYHGNCPTFPIQRCILYCEMFEGSAGPMIGR